MPVLADLESEVTFNEGDSTALLDSNVSVSDSGPGFNGGSLVITGFGPDDVLDFLSDGFGPGQVSLIGPMLYHEGLQVGRVVYTPSQLYIFFESDSSTATAIEAVIEHITFFNGSDNPGAVRTLTFTLTDANGDVATDGEALFLQSGPNDPLHSLNLGGSAHLAVGDIDNDGDQDMIAGVYDDGYHLVRNDGSAAAPDFVHDDAQLSLTGSVGNTAGMTLYDITGDGFLDLIVGRYGGTIQTFAGDGTFAFTELTDAANPFDGIQTYSFAAPGLADVDGDGFVDLVVARGGGRFEFFAGSGAGFVQLTGAANPLGAFVNYGGGGSVSFADIDSDGDLDFISGGGENSAVVFRNDSTIGNPAFTAITNVYNENLATGLQPVLVDIDNDGDFDLIAAPNQGAVELYLLGPATPSIDVIVVGVDDAAVVVDDFQTVDANAPVTGNLLSNDSDVDNALVIAQATVNGQSIAVGEENVFYDGTRLTLGYDGQYSVILGSDARDLGAAGSGATNNSLQYVLVYTLENGEVGTATLTINGVDDKDYLNGTIGDDIIAAGLGNDYIVGYDGFNSLYGQDGNDTLYGGLDVDNLYGGNGADKLYGDGGDDFLDGGAGPNYLYGGDGADDLLGGGANDYLDGGDGVDGMAGGLGNDVYIVDSTQDVVTEAADGGYDIVRTFVSLTSLAANVEAVQLQGTGDLNAVGNELANNMQGNAGANTLNGGSGADTINGGDGDDVIIGGEIGDHLRGGAGADTFVVAHAFAAGLETDIIYDFSALEGDTMDFSGAYSGTLSVVSGFTKAAGQMTLTYAADQTLVRIDINGDGRPDYQVKINGDVRGEVGDWLL